MTVYFAVVMAKMQYYHFRAKTMTFHILLQPFKSYGWLSSFLRQSLTSKLKENRREMTENTENLMNDRPCLPSWLVNIHTYEREGVMKILLQIFLPGVASIR